MASFIKEVQGKLNQNLTLPPGYYIKYGGQFENLEAAKARLSIAVPISLGLIFVMLFFAFNSFKYAILIYTTVPMSAIGGVLALYIRDMPFSISAGVGFIALFGVAVLNGIVLISYFNQLKKEGNMSIMEIIITGGLARLRPVVMTAAVASMGFLPMALSTTAGAEVQKPLATVVIGGLISSTLLTLILLPIIYNLVEKRVKISKAVIIALPLLIMSIFPGKVGAQTLTQEAAIDSALNRNQLITNAELAIRQAESMHKGAMKLGPTQLDLSYGQMNSSINDTYLAVTQNFGNPLQQAKTTKANKVQVALQAENSKLLKRMIIRNVKMTWQDLLFRKSVVDRYNSQIEITKSYQQKAENQQQAGELSNSELGLIVMQQSDLYRLLALAEINYSDAVEAFKQLTKINNIDDIADSLALLTFDYAAIDEQFDVSLLAPFMKNNEFRSAKVKEANSAYFPEVSLAYFNQSIDGLNGFQGVRGGVAFPLWFKPQKQAVVQAKLDVEIAENNLAFQSDEYQYQYQNAINKLQKINALYQSSLDNWSDQNTILLNAVEQELVLGEIDYFKYVQITNRVLSTAINRLELVNSLNKAIIEVEYFTNEQ